MLFTLEETKNSKLKTVEKTTTINDTGQAMKLKT